MNFLQKPGAPGSGPRAPAAESGARLEMLANKVIEISGVPKGTKPDSEILDDVYGR